VAEGLREVGLEKAIAQGATFNFLAVTYLSALTVAKQKLQTGEGSPRTIVSRLIEWSLPLSPQSSGLRYPQLIGEIASTLLIPWKSRPPEESVKEDIKKFLIQQVGDPRIRPGAWQNVDPGAKEIFLRWLAGETLGQFFELLSRSADQIWQFRKKFWMAYYERGAITEAWFALGPNAAVLARQLRQRMPGLAYAQLNRAQDRKQSVLIMKLGGFTVAEWSHNGKCRFWTDADSHAPKLYKSAYDADDLRDLCQFEQIHYHSANGTWQREVSGFVRGNTGIHIPSSSWA
jgi:hypothetical protein